MADSTWEEMSLPKRFVGIVVGIPFVLLLVMFFFVGPLQLVMTSCDLLRMNRQAIAEVSDVKVVDRRSDTRVEITYSFDVGGLGVESQRIYAGLGAFTSLTGGSVLAKKYQVGKLTPVYFDSTDVERCCLEFGWDKWSIGLTLIPWGFVAAIISYARRLIYFPVAMSCIFSGFGLLFFGSETIEVSKVHLYLIAFAFITIATIFHNYFKPVPTASAHEEVDKHASTSPSRSTAT